MVGLQGELLRRRQAADGAARGVVVEARKFPQVTRIYGAVHGVQGLVAEREVRGDTLVVNNLAGSVWGDTLEMVPEVSIGALDGPEEYLLGQVGAALALLLWLRSRTG